MTGGVIAYFWMPSPTMVDREAVPPHPALSPAPRGRGIRLADRRPAKNPSQNRVMAGRRITSRRPEKAGFCDIPLQFLGLGPLFGGPGPDQAEGRLCVHSALHQRDTATGRPDRLWCPPRKAIRPAVPFSTCPPRVAAGLPHKGFFCHFQVINVAKQGGARQRFTAPPLS
jgi:hypothetical protein